MSIYGLKPRFQSLLRPLARALFAAGATANQITLAACVISVALGAWVTLDYGNAPLFLLIPAWMLIRMAFNAIDGMLAREFGQQSELGAYLNEITDVVSDAALYLPFAFVPDAPIAVVWLTAFVIALSIVSEMAGVLGVMVGASRRYDGPMGKSDRAFVFGLLGLLVGLGVNLGDHLVWILAAVAILIAFTIVNRIRRGLVEANADAARKG